jgi:hypothetical protein
MAKVDEYRAKLKSLPEWDEFLLGQSGLPGPRGNLELAQAVAEEGDESLFARYREYSPERAPTNTPQEFLAFCGVLGLWKRLVAGDRQAWEELRGFAADPRWRVREAVAMALQHYGDADREGLARQMQAWAKGDPYEQRAAIAALCEPRLLDEAGFVLKTLEILDQITASLSSSTDRKNEATTALKKGLGYCWSVAVAALPEQGKPRMEAWFASTDPDVRWVMRENLKKARLERMDEGWVKKWREDDALLR